MKTILLTTMRVFSRTFLLPGLLFVLALFLMLLATCMARAADLQGIKIINIGQSIQTGTDYVRWGWTNASGHTIAVKRVQLIANNANGTMWILRREKNDVILITTNPDGATMDFGNDYMSVAAGESLDLYVLPGVSASVYVWAYQMISNPAP